MVVLQYQRPECPLFLKKKEKKSCILQLSRDPLEDLQVVSRPLMPRHVCSFSSVLLPGESDQRRSPFLFTAAFRGIRSAPPLLFCDGTPPAVPIFISPVYSFLRSRVGLRRLCDRLPLRGWNALMLYVWIVPSAAASAEITG